MKVTFGVLCLALSLNLMAAMPMKPGLWNVKMKMESGGEEIDPAAQMREAMANMPAEQRKKMEQMMGSKMKVGFNENGAMKVCYTEQMLKDPGALSGKQSRDCKTNIKTQTSSKIVTEFSCADGTKGLADWSIKNDKSYKGKVDLTSKDGKKSKINYEGKFSSTDCGNIKPIL